MHLIKYWWKINLINKRFQDNQKKTSIGTTGGAPMSNQFSTHFKPDIPTKQK